MTAALEVVLELARGTDAAVDEAYPLGEAQYLLRHGDGAQRSARFPWSEKFHTDLKAIQGTRPDDQALERVGKVLREFFDKLGWAVVEAEITQALKTKREVRVTVRTMAGELRRLPVELLALRPGGDALGRAEGCHVQWEWPETASAAPAPAAPPEGGVVVLGWSTAGGGLDVAGQRRAIQRACAGHPDAEVSLVEVANASLRTLQQALDGVRADGKRVAVLHLLCHGGALPGGGHGLSLNGAGGGEEVVAPGTLAAALEGYAGLVGCVVLCACEGANLGEAANALGSVAERLHRAGFPAVVGSRVALSREGAETFTAAFHDALLLEGEPFHRAVAAARGKLCTGATPHEWAALQAYARQADRAQHPVVFSPYRGLRPFEARHRRFFFGREALTKQLVERVLEASRGERPRFQVVAGTSGSGKSSLVKAGLVPALPATWRVVTLRPGESEGGLALLARRLHAAGDAAARPVAGADEAAVMAEARHLQETKPGPVLLVVDQLEEAFRLPGDEPGRFLECLWGLAKDEALKLVVVSTFRADLLERAQDMVLGEGMTLQAAVYLEAHRLYVGGMGAEELLQAIQRPLEAVGLSFEPGVAEQLRDEAGKEPGALPLLEHALEMLWREREGRWLTRAAYGRLGLSGALSKRLDGLWDGLPVEQRRQGERLLVELVDIADDVKLSTRRRRRLEEVRPSGKARAAAFDAVLENLVTKQRLVVRGREEAAGGPAWVEMAHEALIRRWPRLQGWLKAEKERERRIELERAEQERAQRIRVRRARLIATGFAVALVGETGLVTIAYSANARRREAIEKALAVANLVVFTADRELEPIGGTGPVRRKLLEQVGKLQDELRTASGEFVDATRLRMVTHNQRGDVALSHDDLAKARTEYQAALALTEAIAQADPTNAQLQRDLSVSYSKLGDVAQVGGDLKAARDFFSKARAITEAIAQADPTSAQLQRDLSMSYERLGDVAQVGGDLKAARDFFSKALAITEAIAQADPTNAQLQRDLSIRYNKLGEVAQAGGDFKAARDFFSRALAITEAIAQADPTNAQLQRDLSISYNRLGEVAQAGGDFKAARDFFSKALAITEAIAQADPTNAQLQRDLAVSCERLGVLNVLEKGAIDTSRTWLRRALQLRREVVAGDSENAEAALELVRAARLAALVELSTGTRREAMVHLAEARATLDRVVKLGVSPEHPAIRQLAASLDEIK